MTDNNLMLPYCSDLILCGLYDIYIDNESSDYVFHLNEETGELDMFLMFVMLSEGYL